MVERKFSELNVQINKLHEENNKQREIINGLMNKVKEAHLTSVILDPMSMYSTEQRAMAGNELYKFVDQTKDPNEDSLPGNVIK